jgi:hypothetical protein
LLEGLESGLEVDEFELQAQRGRQSFEDAAAGRDDFFANAVAGDEACRKDWVSLRLPSSDEASIGQSYLSLESWLPLSLLN